MAQPPDYTRQYNFTDYATTNPSDPLPGVQIDGELNKAKLTLDALVTNIGLIQRDDGILANASVHKDAFDTNALALIGLSGYTNKGNWSATTSYVVGDLVNFNSATYLATVAHTSSAAFATDTASKWILLANGAINTTSYSVDKFEGTGSQTAFTLSYSYSSTTDVLVFVNGALKNPTDDYTISGTTLTFVAAPSTPSQAGNENVIIWGGAVVAEAAKAAATASASNASGFADEAESWAKKTNGIVESTDYSSKAWAIGGTGVTDTASKGAAKEWAIETASTVDGTDYSAKEYAIGTQIRGSTGSAKDWAQYTSGTVDGSNYSSKYWATSTPVTNVSTNISDVTTVAGEISPTNNIATVAGKASEITTLAGLNTEIGNLGAISTAISGVNTISSAVTAVNTNASNVNTVSGISSDITTVAGISSAVSAVNSNATNINTVSGISANVTTVAGVSSDVTAVAGISSAVTAVNSNASNINTVSGNNANITTVAGIDAAVSTVAGISSAISTVSGISSQITAINNDLADVQAVAADLAETTSEIDVVAGSIANVDAVGGAIANVNTVASNLTGINAFANQYSVGSSDPTTNLDEGDLFFNTTSDTMKVYNGSSWQNAGSSVNGTSARGSFTATAGQTTFSATYDVGFIDIYANGSKQSVGTDVIASNGSSFVFASGLAAGDIVEYVAFGTFSVSTALATSGGTMTGAITFASGQTFDGRDVSVDGAKLDNIEVSATADQTAAEIRTLVESASDSNVFTDADHTKLNGIEASATADQTGAEIKTAYEAESDTNAFTDALLTKLNGIAASATNVTNNNQLTNGAGYVTSDTTYSAGSGLDLSGTTFSVESDLRGEVFYMGRDNSDYFAAETTQFNWYLDSNLDMQLQNDGDLHVDGNVVAYSTTTSDPRLKENIEPIKNALDKVNQLNGYTFDYIADGKKSAGILSTEVLNVLPSAVSRSTLPVKMGEDNDTEYDVVQYDQLHALLIEAIKTLTKRVDKLESE